MLNKVVVKNAKKFNRETQDYKYFCFTVSHLLSCATHIAYLIAMLGFIVELSVPHCC